MPSQDWYEGKIRALEAVLKEAAQECRELRERCAAHAQGAKDVIPMIARMSAERQSSRIALIAAWKLIDSLNVKDGALEFPTFNALKEALLGAPSPLWRKAEELRDASGLRDGAWRHEISMVEIQVQGAEEKKQ